MIHTPFVIVITSAVAKEGRKEGRVEIVAIIVTQSGKRETEAEDAGG